MNCTSRRILSTAATGILSLATALPATAAGSEVWTDPAHAPDGSTSAPGGVRTEILEVPVDDHAWECAQMGLGALAGAAAVGAAAVVLRRREHHAPRPV